MFNTLKFKLTLTAFLILSVIMSLSTWRDIRDTEKKLLEVQKEKAVLLSERIAHGIMVLMLKNRWQDMHAFMKNLIEDSRELKEIRIFHPESGLIVTSSEHEEIGRKIYEQDMERFETQGAGDAFLLEKGGNQYASKLTVIRNQPECHQCHGPEKEILGVLDVEISLSELQSTIAQFKKEHLRDALVGFVLIAGGFLLVIGLLIDRPIRKMIRTIRSIEAGELSARMDEDKMDELGHMARSFNSMLSSLESAKQEIEQCHAAQMQRAAKLASLGEVISGIAHEIKNPLTGISCAVQVIHSELSETDGRRAVTAEILNHIKRLDRTVKDLLNYARPKPPNFLLLNPEDVLNKAVFFVYPEARKSSVVIETASSGEVPEVMIDPDQMQQVFLNLMINAVQAMPRGGTLKITIARADIDRGDSAGIKEALGREALLIRFEDTGAGIEDEIMDSIFDPFFTKKSRGTGLGLAISRRIVQEHGGDITVKSEPGRGSTFSLYLPLIQSRPDTGEAGQSGGTIDE